MRAPYVVHPTCKFCYLMGSYSSQVHPMSGEQTASSRPTARSGTFCSQVPTKCRLRRDVWCVFCSATTSFRTHLQRTVHYRHFCHLRGFPEFDFGGERKRVRCVSTSQYFRVYGVPTKIPQLDQREESSVNEQTCHRLCKFRERVLGSRFCTYLTTNQKTQRVLTCPSKP